MKEFKLPKEFAEKWLIALRGGGFKQCKSTLFDNGTYCCLGVAGYIAGIDNEKMNGWGFLGHATKIEDGLLPEILVTKSDDNGLVSEVVYMNDAGKSFTQIADWLEANVKFI